MLNKKFFFGLVFIASLTGSALANSSDLSPEAQKTVQIGLVKKLQASLQTSAQNYNSHLNDTAYFEKLVSKFGHSKKEIQALKESLGTGWLSPREKAVWANKQVIIASGKVTVKIGVDDALDGSMHINEKIFKFDNTRPLVETVAKLRQAIHAANDVSLSRSLLERLWATSTNALLANAYAEQDKDFYVETKLAGTLLSLHYTISDSDINGNELSILNSALKAELATCRGADSQNYAERHDRLSQALETAESTIATLDDANYSQNPHVVTHSRIASCADIEKYSKGHTYVVYDGIDSETSEPAYERIYAIIPKDICGNLKALQACLKTKTKDQIKAISDVNKQQIKTDDQGQVGHNPGQRLVSPGKSTQPAR